MSTGDPAAVGRSQTRGFMFADLRGYSAFTEQHGDDAARELLVRYRELVREVIGRAGGAEIRTEGDSFYVVFTSVSEAVLAGLAILEAARAGTKEPEPHPIRIGIGVHAGETVDSAAGIVSSAVNIAARICSVAGAGELLVSDTVRALTRTQLDVAFESRGRRRLKGITDQLTLYQVRPGGTSPALTPGRLAGLTGRWRDKTAVVGGLVVLILGTTVVGAALMRDGFGGSPEDNQPSASAVTTILVPSPDPAVGILPVGLEAGTHQFDKLSPVAVFDIPMGNWWAYRDYLDAAGLYMLDPGVEEVPPPPDAYLGWFDFGRVQVVFDGGCIESDTILLDSSPNALVDWLQGHDLLETSTAQPVNVAGYSGLQVDVTVAQVETDPCETDGPAQRTFLYPVGQDFFSLLPGERLRVITLDVGGRPFSILITSEADTFDTFAELVRPILESLRLTP